MGIDNNQSSLWVKENNAKQTQMRDKCIEKRIFNSTFASSVHYPCVCLCKHVHLTPNTHGKVGGIWVLVYTQLGFEANRRYSSIETHGGIRALYVNEYR